MTDIQQKIFLKQKEQLCEINEKIILPLSEFIKVFSNGSNSDDETKTKIEKYSHALSNSTMTFTMIVVSPQLMEDIDKYMSATECKDDLCSAIDNLLLNLSSDNFDGMSDDIDLISREINKFILLIE